MISEAIMTAKAAIKNILRKSMGKGIYKLSKGMFEFGNQTISSSFPPYEELSSIGARETYFIHSSYVHRTVAIHDATGAIEMGDDDYRQVEVYRFAKEIVQRHSLRVVADVGCGMGHKLVKYFPDHHTIGYDIPATVVRLKQRYPRKQWEAADLSSPNLPPTDLVIAADVIEHVPDPDMMLAFILRMKPKYVVLSTPDRNLLRYGTHNGPPKNPFHLREWNMPELHAYLSEFFAIDAHFISCPPQATQCALLRPRPGTDSL